MSVYHIQETNTHEHLYESANLSEANWLLGTSVKFTPTTDYSRDINSDYRPTYEDTHEINILFDDNPKATLRHLDWLAEDEELPYLVYISNIIYPKFKQFKRDCKSKHIDVKQAFESMFNDDGTPTPDNTFYIDVERYSIVELPYRMKTSGTQKFVVTDIQGDSVNPFIWLCKLAPYHDQVDLVPDTTDTKDDKISDDKDSSLIGNIYLKV